jgi:hypothetical protein
LYGLYSQRHRRVGPRALGRSQRLVEELLASCFGQRGKAFGGKRGGPLGRLDGAVHAADSRLYLRTRRLAAAAPGQHIQGDAGKARRRHDAGGVSFILDARLHRRDVRRRF